MMDIGKRCIMQDYRGFRDVDVTVLFCCARLGAPESRDMLWRKSRLAWMKAYDELLDQADWFIRGDDDTYMVRL